MAGGNILFIGIYFIITLATWATCTSIIGPRILRPHSRYRVTIAGGTKTQSLYIAIEGRTSNGEQYNQEREVQIQPATSRIVDIEIGDPGPGQYTLVARSTSGPQFASAAPLMYQPRSFCVFIQTDKRVYQPGDNIYFRVISLDKYLQPLDGVVDVSVLDTGGSPVKQWINVPLDRGVISADLRLADEPALGEWTIEVDARGQKYSRQILIADYVMPKFELDVQVPHEVLFSEGRFTVNVSAKHFNGLPVRGELTLSAYAVFFSGVLQPVFSSPARKVVEFNGQAEVTYDLKTDLDLAEDAARPLVVEAVLEERNTLIKQNVSSRILLLRTPYRLKVTAPDFFKPTLPYNVQIEVVEPSGALMPVSDEVSVERLWDDGAPVNTTTLKLDKGRATYTLVPDAPHARSTLNLVIKYKDVSERVVHIKSSSSKGGKYLTAQLLSTSGDELRARITSTEQMDVINYAVIGRGDVLFSKSLELSPARRSVDVRAALTPAMSPGCVLLAWYPQLDQTDVLASAIYVPYNKLLQQQPTVRIGGGGLRPGGGVEIQMTGEAGSFAALMIEDQNAIKTGLADSNGLGSGFNMHTIEREVESFSGLKHSIFNNEDHQPVMGIDLGGNTTADVFRNAGVVILTDGFISRPSEEEVIPVEVGTRPPLAGPYAFSRLPPPPAPRYYLTHTTHPTWTLNNLTIPDDGRGTINRLSPVTSGTWSVGGFVVHPRLGLGLAPPQTFTTSTPLSISTEIPETLQKGESLAVVVTVSTTLTVDTSVEVTFHNSEQHFEFEPLENNVDSTKKIEVYRRERVTVPSSGSISTAFLVTAVKNGEAPIIVEASGNGVSASLFRSIVVKDGFEEENWMWTLLDGRTSNAKADIVLRKEPGWKAGPSSLKVAGHLLAPALFAARTPGPRLHADPIAAARPLALAAVLLQHLQKNERDDDIAVMAEMRVLAAEGYQRLMAYRKPDGSFAAEIGDKTEGDVFMTATAARWLARGSRYVPVAPGAAAAAARWLVRKQLGDGSWDPPAPANRHDQRAQRILPLTAHCLMALLAQQSNDVIHKNAINKAIDFLARGMSADLDAYTLAVVGRALAAARHPQATQALNYLDQYVNGTGDIKWWDRTTAPSERRNPWLLFNSAEASTAGWGLKALIDARLIDHALPVAKYILAAYKPSNLDPDTVEALAELTEALGTSINMRLLVNVTGSDEMRQFNVDDDNALIVQTQLIRNSRNVSVSSSGRGVPLVGLVAVSASNVTGSWPRYTLDPRVDATSTHHRIQLSICYGFVAQGNETVSGFTLMIVQLPSGYFADIDTITELMASNHVSTARLISGGSGVAAWLRPLGPQERCATLSAPRALPVARQRPGYVTLTDLYDSSHRARVFFSPVVSRACDVCVWPSCGRACGAASAQRAPEPGTNDSGNESGTKSGNAARTLLIPTSWPTLVILLLASVR